MIVWIRTYSVFFDPVPHRFDYPRDRKDEPYIDLAIAAGAVYLVSWDRDIRDLKDASRPDGRRFMEENPSVVILDPKEFLAAYFQQDSAL